jgi:D-glycero-alpha-D-manno-heptose-7-phosphate kinase
MIIKASTPCRISLFGGGTDIPEYAEKYGGIVISFAINLRQYITLYTDSDIFSHPEANTFPHDATPAYLYKILEEYGLNSGHFIKIDSKCDAVLKAGLGSSSAAGVALIGAINKAKNLKLSIDQIAQKAWEIETQKMGWYAGKQDAWASVHGGSNIIEFNNTVKTMRLTNENIKLVKESMVLFYIGKRKVINPQEGLRNLTMKQIETLHNIKKTTIKSLKYIKKGDYNSIGKMLDKYWEIKKQVNRAISNERIDIIYKKARDEGAIGGKLLGAGGGGYMFFIIDPNKKHVFIKNLYKINIENVDFDIDKQGLDSRIIKE